MHPSAELIVTPRLLLRSVASTDIQTLYDHVLSDTAVMSAALSGEPMSLSQSKRFIDRNFDHGSNKMGLGVLVERETDQVIGFAGLLRCAALGDLDFELGFVLRRSAWGHGYATEIGRGQLHYGFRNLGLSRVLALVSPTNNASIAVLEKIGMELHSKVHAAERGERLVYAAQKQAARGRLSVFSSRKLPAQF